MNVVAIISQFPPYVTAGLGRYAECVHPHITNRHRLHVFTINPGHLPAVESHADLTVHRPIGRVLGSVFRRRALNRTRRLDFMVLALNVIVSNVRFFVGIRRLSRRERIDVIAVHDPTNFVGALLCARFVDAPIVFHLHTTEYGLAPRRTISDPLHIFRAIERRLGRVAERVVVPSSETAALLAGGGFERSKIVVVPQANTLESVVPEQGFDADVLDARNRAARRRCAVDADEKVLLFVGRLGVQKGVYPLLEAMVTIVDADPRIRLLLVGEGDRAGVRRIATATGLEAHVTLSPGFSELDELLDYYAMADVCIFPSLYEPFGLVALEAMSLAKPVILGDGFSKVFEGEPQRPAVRYVRSADPRHIAQVVVEVMSDEDAQAALGRRAFALQRQFSWRRTADETLAIYRAVAAAGSTQLSGG